MPEKHLRAIMVGQVMEADMFYARNTILGFVAALLVATAAGVARGHRPPRLDPQAPLGITARDSR